MSDQTKARAPRVFSHYVLKSAGGYYSTNGINGRWVPHPKQATQFSQEELHAPLFATAAAFFVPVTRPVCGNVTTATVTGYGAATHPAGPEHSRCVHKRGHEGPHSNDRGGVWARETPLAPCLSVARSRELVACAEKLLDEGSQGLPKLRNVLADLKKELS